MYYFWRLQIFVFFCALFKLRYLHTCVSSLLMANFFLIWWITFLLDQSVPDQNKLFTRDYKMSGNNWSLCQKKIASSFLHLMLLVYKHFSFTLKYQTPWGWQSPQTVLFSFQTLCCLLWLASRALLFICFPCRKADLPSLLYIFHDCKLLNVSTSLRFSLWDVGESFLTKFLSAFSKPWVTKLGLTFKTPSESFLKAPT